MYYVMINITEIYAKDWETLAVSLLTKTETEIKPFFHDVEIDYIWKSFMKERVLFAVSYL